MTADPQSGASTGRAGSRGTDPGWRPAADLPVAAGVLRLATQGPSRPTGRGTAPNAATTASAGDQLDALADLVRSLAAVSGLATDIADAEQIATAAQADGRHWVSLAATIAATVGRCRSAPDTQQVEEAVRRCVRHAAAVHAASTPAPVPAGPGRVPPSPVRTAPRAGAAAAGPAPAPAPGQLTGLRVRCFGEFKFAVGTEPLSWASLRPRARSVLRLLTLRANRGVHVETLYQCFWPGAPLESARRSLHVAVSLIRKVLGEVPEHLPHRPKLVRCGDMYTLEIPPGADLDLVRFTEALRQWRAAARGSDPAEVLAPLRRAFSLYAGDLLPEEGNAEWVLADRARYRMLALDATCALATVELRLGNTARAATVCTKAIGVDRFHDPAWRLLIRAYQLGNEPGAAQQARIAYQEVLAELGVRHQASGPAAG